MASLLHFAIFTYVFYMFTPVKFVIYYYSYKFCITYSIYFCPIIMYVSYAMSVAKGHCLFFVFLESFLSHSVSFLIQFVSTFPLFPSYPLVWRMFFIICKHNMKCKLRYSANIIIIYILWEIVHERSKIENDLKFLTTVGENKSRQST